MVTYSICEHAMTWGILANDVVNAIDDSLPMQLVARSVRREQARFGAPNQCRMPLIDSNF